MASIKNHCQLHDVNNLYVSEETLIISSYSLDSRRGWETILMGTVGSAVFSGLWGVLIRGGICGVSSFWVSSAAVLVLDGLRKERRKLVSVGPGKGSLQRRLVVTRTSPIDLKPPADCSSPWPTGEFSPSQLQSASLNLPHVRLHHCIPVELLRPLPLVCLHSNSEATSEADGADTEGTSTNTELNRFVH